MIKKTIYCLSLSIFLFTMCNKKKKEDPIPETSNTNTSKDEIIWKGGLNLTQVGQCLISGNDSIIKLVMSTYATDSVRFEQYVYYALSAAWIPGSPLLGIIKGNNLTLTQKNKVTCNNTEVFNTYHYKGVIDTVNTKIRLTITGSETWCETEKCIFDAKYVVYKE